MFIKPHTFIILALRFCSYIFKFYVTDNTDLATVYIRGLAVKSKCLFQNFVY